MPDRNVGKPALTRRDVEIAVEVLRGAKPKREAIDRLLERIASLDQLRQIIAKDMRPAERRPFQDRSAADRLLQAGPARIDVDVAPDVLDRLLAHVESVWRGLGESDPYWSVLSRFKSEGGTIDKEAFYKTGAKRISVFTAALARAGIDAASLDTCFELGCGVGRLTVWLADRFRRVIGADISSSHLALAEQEAAARGKDNIEFVRVASVAELASVPAFDAFFSLITLQHSPPPVIKHVLTILLHRLKPGGIAYFQLPTLIPDEPFDAAAYLADLDSHRRMETFAVPQSVMLTLFESLDLRLLEMREDNQIGPAKLSNTFLLQKRHRSGAAEEHGPARGA